jgi:hypothetical protein
VNTQSDHFDQADQEILTSTVTDEAQDAAARMERHVRGLVTGFTDSYCQLQIVHRRSDP